MACSLARAPSRMACSAWRMACSRTRSAWATACSAWRRAVACERSACCTACVCAASARRMAASISRRAASSSRSTSCCAARACVEVCVEVCAVLDWLAKAAMPPPRVTSAAGINSFILGLLGSRGGWRTTVAGVLRSEPASVVRVLLREEGVQHDLHPSAAVLEAQAALLEALQRRAPARVGLGAGQLLAQELELLGERVHLRVEAVEEGFAFGVALWGLERGRGGVGGERGLGG